MKFLFAIVALSSLVAITSCGVIPEEEGSWKVMIDDLEQFNNADEEVANVESKFFDDDTTTTEDPPEVTGSTSSEPPVVTGSSSEAPVVTGSSSEGPGVTGSSSEGPGVTGSSSEGPGVTGSSSEGPGVTGSSTGAGATGSTEETTTEAGAPGVTSSFGLLIALYIVKNALL